jgi:hypothetical protein
MAVSILERPLGYILGAGVTATINEAYAGYATVNKASHGLIDGDYVYITSNIESYNGFFYVNQEDTGKFKIRPYATADDVSYVQDATVTYYPATATHGYNCVHLPIAYRLSSNLYPTNTVDTSVTISSYQDDFGYVNINLSGTIDSGAFPEPLEYVKITGATNSNLNGVYQISEVVSATSITINLPYEDNYQFGSATVIRYYNNYNIVVRVYGGLPASHEWASKKPNTLLSTLYFVPDENNEVYFSISDILRNQIKVTNNLTADTLPSNIDAWTGFYITVAESYDDSLGSQYLLSTYTSAFTDDSSNFQGVAVNTILPFKNIHSGSLTQYLDKFLSTVPVFFDTNYTDISFINTLNNTALTLRKLYTLNGVEVTTVNTAIGTLDKGVIRYEVPINCDLYDKVYVTVLDDATPVTETAEFEISCECSDNNIELSWLNHLGGFDYFVFKAEKEYVIEVEETQTANVNIFNTWPKSYGAFADTIQKNTFRKTREAILVRSQYVKESWLDGLKFIKSSPLVQIINSRTDRRTVIVDSSSFTYKKDGQDLYDISFTITYTDELPSQKV